MAKDYRSKNSSRGHRGSRASKSFLMVLLSFLAGYLIATQIPVESLVHWVQKQTLSAQGKTEVKPKPELKKAELPKPKFEFYTLLTNDRKAPPPSQIPSVAKEIAASPKPASDIAAAAAISGVNKTADNKSVLSVKAPEKSAWLLQVAAFKARQDAERMKASLTLKGFEVNIVAVSQQQGQWFRVMAGPFTDRVKAEQVKLALAKTERIVGILHRV